MRRDSLGSLCTDTWKREDDYHLWYYSFCHMLPHWSCHFPVQKLFLWKPLCGFNILLAISPCNFNFCSLKPFTSLLLVWFQLKSPIWVPSYSPACSGFFTLWPCSVPPVVYPLDSYFVFSSNGSCFFDFCSLSLL